MPTREVERWYWRGTDGGAHERATNEWQEATGDQPELVRLDDIARAMTRWSDNAAADYMLDRVGGPTATLAFARQAGMRTQEMLMPIFGEFVAWATIGLDEWKRLDAADRSARASALAKATRPSALSMLREPSRSEQFDRARTSPAGSPREWARLMSFMYEDNDLPPIAREVIRRHLEWPLSEFASNRERFERLGAKGGSLAGVMTDAMYIKPKGKPPSVFALFLRDLPRDVWLSIRKSFAQQKFILEIVTDREFRQKVQQALDD